MGASPSLASAAGSLLAAFLLPRPSPGLPVVGWWVAVLAGGGAGFVVARRVVVRFAPLAALLDLALAFPAEAPSRYSVVRRARSVDEARRVLESMDEDVAVQAAAEASLALVVALEQHDPGTRGHSERVRLFADLVGAELGIDDHERVRLRWSALLHDLGKLHVHRDILNKPGRPTKDEWTALRQHPLEGDRLVRPLRPWLGGWVDSVVEHHERFDGEGYPFGKAGDQLSLGGRIVAVADSYETMTARRAYKEPRTDDGARAELVACSGTQFDPAIVRAFLAISVPRPTRRAVLVGWLGSLPAMTALDRLPRQATMMTAVAGVSALSVAIAGLVPRGPRVDPSSAEAPPRIVALPDEEGPNERTNSDSVPVASGPARSTAGRGSPSTTREGTRRPDADGTRPSPSPTGAPPGDEAPPPQTVDHVLGDVLTMQATRPGEDHDWVAQWPLDPSAPSTSGRVPNYDRDRDDLPGLTLLADAARPVARVVGVPAWTTEATSASGPVFVGGDALLTLHVALAPEPESRRAVLDADLLDCSPSLTGCEGIASSRLATTIEADGAARWQEVEMPFGVVAHVLRPGRALVLTVTVTDSPLDVLLAFGTTRENARIDGLTVAPVNALALEAVTRPARFRRGEPMPRVAAWRTARAEGCCRAGSSTRLRTPWARH